jgi:hypothetical protein
MVPLLPQHRKRCYCLQQVLDIMHYICYIGFLFFTLVAVYYYFRRWQLMGL